MEGKKLSRQLYETFLPEQVVSEEEIGKKADGKRLRSSRFDFSTFLERFEAFQR